MADTKTTGIVTAKRHQILQDITTQIKGTEVSDICDIAGHKYLMTTITADEEVWADGYTSANSPMAAVTSMKMPVLAASIKSIDGVVVSDLFTFPDSMPEAEQQFNSQDAWHKRYWLMTQLLLWLGDKPDMLISELWKFYIKLRERRENSWDELKKSLARIPGGESKASSSPEKGSSPATQTSNG